jgi:hypothetical protein
MLDQIINIYAKHSIANLVVCNNIAYKFKSFYKVVVMKTVLKLKRILNQTRYNSKIIHFMKI